MPIRGINKKFDFTQIPPQSIQAITIPITHTNRQSRHITPAKLLNFAQSVAELNLSQSSLKRSHYSSRRTMLIQAC